MSDAHVRSDGTPSTARAREEDVAAARGPAVRAADISAWAGQTIQLRVEAPDANPDGLIEAGADNVTLVRQ